MSSPPAAANTSPSPPPGTGSPGALLPGEHWIQQGAPIDDHDSAYEEEVQSSTASLASSIMEYRTIQGRTYHSDRSATAEYWGPNDDTHNEAMDMTHHLLTLVLDGKLFRAPLDENKISKVLDIGTGTGMWAIDFADMYPNAEVIGTDLSPIQPSWVPPNCFFEIEDATQAWTFKENDFDLVHMRYLVGSIPDWTELFKQAYRVLKPGGWLESFESDAPITSKDGTVKDESALHQWGIMFGEAGKRTGRSFLVIDEDLQRKAMEEAGFVNIMQFDFDCPVSGWPADKRLKEIGEFCRATMERDLEGLVLYMLGQIMGWSRAEIQVYVAHLRRQLRDKNVHATFKVRCMSGQKPRDAPASS